MIENSKDYRLIIRYDYVKLNHDGYCSDPDEICEEEKEKNLNIIVKVPDYITSEDLNTSNLITDEELIKKICRKNHLYIDNKVYCCGTKYSNIRIKLVKKFIADLLEELDF